MNRYASILVPKETNFSQKIAYEATIAALIKDRTKQVEVEKVRRDLDQEKVEKLQEKIDKLRSLCRENTKGWPFSYYVYCLHV